MPSAMPSGLTPEARHTTILKRLASGAGSTDTTNAPASASLSHSLASVSDAARSTCLHSCSAFQFVFRGAFRSAEEDSRVRFVVRPHFVHRRETPLPPSP